MTIPLQTDIAYGPVASRRLGRSLGVNVLPAGQKVCNFNCAYCQYGWTPPVWLDRTTAPDALRASAGANADTARKRALLPSEWRCAALPWPSVPNIIEAVGLALARDPAVDRITLAGNGEPTLHPDFARIVDGLRSVRDRHASEARLALLSNASTVGDPGVGRALARVDECYMKLDAGDEVTLRRINGAQVPLRVIVDALRSFADVTLQSLFTRDAGRRVDNTSTASVSRWLEMVRHIRPQAVHVYSIDRDPAWKQLERVPRDELETIAARVEAEGIAAVVF
jgi:wyosine [tRNA(Phe)-imidazoG37] synthetase (radical SAM superfamily)